MKRYVKCDTEIKNSDELAAFITQKVGLGRDEGVEVYDDNCVDFAGYDDETGRTFSVAIYVDDVNQHTSDKDKIQFIESKIQDAFNDTSDWEAEQDDWDY